MMSRQSILCRDLVGQGKETSCRDKRVLCRDRVWSGQEFFCRDIMFLCRDRVNGGEALCCDRIFYVATKLATTESSVAHDRARRARLARTTLWQRVAL